MRLPAGEIYNWVINLPSLASDYSNGAELLIEPLRFSEKKPCVFCERAKFALELFFLLGISVLFPCYDDASSYNDQRKTFF